MGVHLAEIMQLEFLFVHAKTVYLLPFRSPMARAAVMVYFDRLLNSIGLVMLGIHKWI